MKASFFFGAVIVCYLSPAQADTYRCTGADGKVAYQQSPCNTGAQKTVDDSDARARASDRAKIEAQKQADKTETRRHSVFLRACIEDKICASGEYASPLRGKSLAFVIETLGNPESVQDFDGSPIQYFNVPTTDGRKRARLQVTYQRGVVHDSNGKHPDFIGQVVESVNVY